MRNAEKSQVSDIYILFRVQGGVGIFLGRERARVYFYAKGKVGIMLFALRIACRSELEWI